MHDGLFSTDGFIARATCGPAWTDTLVAITIISDIIIYLCYWAIPVVIIAWFRRTKRFGRTPVADPMSVLSMAMFVISCGHTHLLDALMFVWPAYRFAASVYAACAVCSLTALGWFSYRLAKEVNSEQPR